jgi:hypothetical protein
VANRSGQWSVTAGALTPGLVLAVDGLLSGVPAKGGTATFTVTVSDGSTSTSSVFELRVRPKQPVKVRMLR